MDHRWLRLFLGSSFVVLMLTMTSGRTLSIGAEWKDEDGKELLSDSVGVNQRDQSLVSALTKDEEEAVRRRGIALSDSSGIEARSTAGMSLASLNPGSTLVSPGDDVAIVVKRQAHIEKGAVQNKKPKPKLASKKKPKAKHAPKKKPKAKHAPKKKPKAKHASKKKPKAAKKSKGHKQKANKPAKKIVKAKPTERKKHKENSDKEEEKTIGASIPKGNSLLLDNKKAGNDSKKATNTSIDQLLNKTTSNESIHIEGYKSQPSKSSFIYQNLTSTTTGPSLSNANLNYTMPNSQLNNSNDANKIFDYQRLISKQNGVQFPNIVFGGGKFGSKNNHLQIQKKTHVHRNLQHGQNQLFSKIVNYGKFGSEQRRVGLSNKHFNNSKQHEHQNNLFRSETSKVGLPNNHFNHRKLHKHQNNLFSSKSNFDNGKYTRQPYKVYFSNDNFDQDKLNRKSNLLYSPNKNYDYGKFTTGPSKVSFTDNKFNNGKVHTHTNLNNLYLSNNNFGNGKLTPEYNNLLTTSTEFDRGEFTPSENNILRNKNNKWQHSYNKHQYRKPLSELINQQPKYNDYVYAPVVYPKAQVKYDYTNGDADDVLAPWR